MFSSILEAVDVLKQGKMIIVIDDENRENEGDILALANNVSMETINFMITYGRGLVCCPITAERAKKLNLPLMVSNNTENLRTAFTVSVDHVSNTTGISASERAETVRALASDEAKPVDFKKPGHTFPLIATDGGVLERPGHTEAAVDLAKLCGADPSGVICEVIKDDGSMARLPDLITFSEKHDLKIVTIADLVKYLKN
ncbi:3,4-dihydroxy-2-butanone 4-phosphate synthase [Aquibacillus albus]|uniref:3,4-dihydroxy-2-butanone 4-phosphate synthase n=1 Tax=Aquibacillus albus TaxID=1168171 RepID=A0ABS2MXH5_9BACI|nr:3,4-dihydroxy-2-butanone 4-phosphate synthase [Aquibacillus albus]